jgi:hypothetical protein
MKHLKIQFTEGLKEGWILFWSPIKMAINATKVAPSKDKGPSGQFMQGMREGWTTFWSPFALFGRAIKKAFAAQ